MSLQRTRLTEVQFVPDTVGAIYTNPTASVTSFIKGFVFHNIDTAPQTVAVHWVPDSSSAVGTAIDANKFLDIQLESKETFIFEIPFALVMLDQNETIQAVASDNDKVTCIVFGDKES